jgi:hypothetical protein
MIVPAARSMQESHTAPSPPTPTARTYRVLGLPHGAAVEECIAAFDRLNAHYDPRRWPADPTYQHWAIAHTDDLDEALALIFDAVRWERVAA